MAAQALRQRAKPLNIPFLPSATTACRCPVGFVEQASSARSSGLVNRDEEIVPLRPQPSTSSGTALR
jgi:hypothetical protein